MAEVKRTPIHAVRAPLSSKLTHFQSCELCYGKENCCTNAYATGDDQVVLVAGTEFTDWDGLSQSIQDARNQGKYTRLIVDQPVPDDILWAASYDHRNVLQINVDIQQDMEQLIWTTNLAHAAERCGLFFVFMVYPILPGRIHPHHVLMIIDTIRSIPHCVVMLRFALFKDTGQLSSDEYLYVNGAAVPKECLSKVGDYWSCTDEYKHSFMSKIFPYTRFRRIDTMICGGTSI